MKLINRDKFISDMFDFYIENRWSPRDIHFSLLDVRSNIDSPEFEVKAIPIEWIKKYMDKVDIEESGMVYLSPSGPFRDMLKEWVKENE